MGGGREREKNGADCDKDVKRQWATTEEIKSCNKGTSCTAC